MKKMNRSSSTIKLNKINRKKRKKKKKKKIRIKERRKRSKIFVLYDSLFFSIVCL